MRRRKSSSSRTPRKKSAGHLAGVERAVDDERLLAAKEVVELVADGLRPQGGRLLAVDVVDERLGGMDGVGVGERFAEALVEELDELAEQAHRDVAAPRPVPSPPIAVPGCTSSPPSVIALRADLGEPVVGERDVDREPAADAPLAQPQREEAGERVELLAARR